MKKLVVRADDLGYSEGVSLGILAAHRDGIVTCASVMVNMPYTKEAIRQAKQYPNLSLGLHVNVTNGKALANADKIPHLVDQNGEFISSKIRREQIKEGVTLFPEEEAYQEALAQLDRFVTLVGRLPDYIDVHVLEVEPLIKAIVRVMKTRDIPTSPYADENFKEAREQAMAQYEMYQTKKADVYRFFTEEHFSFTHEVELLVCHPGFIDYQVSITSTMLEERLLDYALVTSDEVKNYLKKQNIQLVNFNNYQE